MSVSLLMRLTYAIPCKWCFHPNYQAGRMMWLITLIVVAVWA